MYTKPAFALKLFCLAALLQFSAAQNTSACSVSDKSLINLERYQKIARSAVFRYLAGEDGEKFDAGRTSKQVLTDENLTFLRQFMKILDPGQVKESVYAHILQNGQVPDGPLANLDISWIIEEKASQFIRNLQGATKVTLDFLRDFPHLKYNIEEMKKQLVNDFKNLGNEWQNDASTLASDNDPLELCRADLDYLYDPLLDTLGCLITEVINGVIKNITNDCKICLGPFCTPNLCLDITAPTRPIPDVTGTFVDAQFKIPPGLTQGNLHWAGSFDQCSRIDDVTYNTSLVGLPGKMQTLKARYCRVKAWPAGDFVNGSIPSLALHLGVCVPNSCATPEAIENITADFEVIGLRVFEMFCGFEDVKLQDDPASETAVAIIIIIAIVVLCATIYDMLIRKPVLAAKIKKVLPDMASGSKTGSPIPSSPIEGARSGLGYAPFAEKPMPGNGPPLPVTFTIGSDEKNIHGVSNNGTLPIQKPLSRQTSYTELHNDDFRKYSLNSDQDIYPALGRPPSYVSQVSTMSTSDLLNNEVGAMKQRALVPSPLDEAPSLLERLEACFVAFSGYSNARRVFDLDSTSDRLLSCDGIKVMSLVWSVYGYTWLLGTLYSEAWTTTNLLPEIMTVVRTFLFQVVINFPFSADSTFVVVGCLLTYNWMRQFDKEKKITWRTVVYYYLHRYFRLMIPMMLVLMFYALLYKLIVAGPLIPPNISDADRCRSQWYLNFFFVHNIVNDNGMCLTWTFNVAIIFQFHLIGPLILVPLALMPKIGYAMFGVTYLAHIITLGVYAADLADTSSFGVWFNDIILTPWCRAGPILIGMATGYGIFMHKKRQFNVPYLVRVVAWICSIGFLMAPIFSTYDSLREGGNSWSRAETINYQLWSRSAFGLGVAWLIFSAETGVGGFPGRFLRYKEWVPLSRLSYITLLFSPIFIFRNVYSQMQPITITGHVMLYFFFANMTWSLLISLCLSLLMQFPFCELENALLYKTKRDLIKMGRNPLNEMSKAQNISRPQTLQRPLSSTQDINMTLGGLTRTLSGNPAVDLHRTISQTSQL